MWQGILGHDAVVERFRRALNRERLASTFLFVGPRGIGKHSIALRLAQALLCQARPIEQLNPCGSCDSCLQVLAATHPDLLLIAKPADKSFIPLSLLIGDDQHRMRAGLCHDIALRPFYGHRKVAIIDDADDLNEEGANALLKTLEEPPPRSVLILVGTTADKQLPTIRSRCQIVRFQSLGVAEIAELLVAQGLVEGGEEAQRLARLSQGSLAGAAELADDELSTFRDQFLTQLKRIDSQSVALARETNAFVDAAGKDAPARRRRLRQIIRLALEYHRGRLRVATGLEPSDKLASAPATIEAQSSDDWQVLADQVERSLEGLGQVDRNAHQATLIDCWLDDLGEIQAGYSAAEPRG
jgi:DNA polymerase III subunit delta'